tara:strand:- start:1686 stop:2042 length:357 start_codon:yes stop_codon:yes gene_type:complete
MTPKPIHVQIREAREAKGWSQNELGRQSGMTGKAIWRIETGANTTIQTVEKLAAAMGARFDGVIHYDASQEKNELLEAARMLPPELAGLGARILKSLPRVSPSARGILLSWLALDETE